MTTKKDINERRASDRFPIERDILYKVTNRQSEDETGLGRTVNMSSSGVLFATEASLIAGRRVELAIDWPAQMNNTVPRTGRRHRAQLLPDRPRQRASRNFITVLHHI